MIEDEKIVRTESFVKSAFQENPHFSFGDWSVMHDHSVMVKDLAERIALEVGCDSSLAAIGALLHDIGKTYRSDPDDLHKNHEKYNLLVARDFLGSLELSEKEREKIEALISYQDDSDEMKVIKDADALALFLDKRLYMLYIEWAVENRLDDSIQRKLDKFDRLNFGISRSIGEQAFLNMKKEWGEYIEKIKNKKK